MPAVACQLMLFAGVARSMSKRDRFVLVDLFIFALAWPNTKQPFQWRGSCLLVMRQCATDRMALPLSPTRPTPQNFEWLTADWSDGRSTATRASTGKANAAQVFMAH